MEENYEDIDMKILKDIIKSTLISILVSTFIFVIVGLIFDQVGGGTFALDNYRFTKMVAACVVTGLGFGVPTFLYNMENIPMPLASVIHLGVGFTVYFFAASRVGWIPKQAGTVASVCTIVGVIVVGLIIWACFLKYNKNLSDRMNKALEAK
ncbi:Protein of unknown function [Lachnospiraceae bacterium NE2001]|nr:Protein of unknown function [Lachnospiraceae bacterium NE2001]